VVLLFHELGHGIHDLVAKTKYAYFHGTMTVIDFGEAPSQMLERWCWIPERMKALSRHYSYLSPEYRAAWEEQADGALRPPERIPDEMVGALMRTKMVYGAQYQLQNVALACFDMRVHEPKSREALKAMDMPAEYGRLRVEHTNLEGTRRSARDTVGLPGMSYFRTWWPRTTMPGCTAICSESLSVFGAKRVSQCVVPRCLPMTCLTRLLRPIRWIPRPDCAIEGWSWRRAELRTS
jgi:hypothetical protein